MLRIIPLRLRSLFHAGDVERELNEELTYHLEQQTAANVAAGMSPDAARTAALRAFGGVELRKEQVRDTRGTRWIEDTLGDVRFALRSLGRARGFSIAVILTLALGIGANTAMFTLLRGTMLKALPNRNGDRLVYLRLSAPGEKRVNTLFSVPEVADFRASSRTLGEIAEYSDVMPFTLVGTDGRIVRADAAVVSGNYFSVLGLDPVLGRLTDAHDDGAAAAPVAVLSSHYWMDHFGGDPGVLGRIIKMNGMPAQIVGVVQPAPQYPNPVDVFINTVTSPHHLGATMNTLRTHRMTEIFARLAPNASVEQARAEIGSIAARMIQDHPDSYQKAGQYTVALSTLRDAENAQARLTFWLLMGAAAFVLLIACANVSNLTLMRGLGREREMLLRTALGARGGRLRRLLLVENLVLALIGGGLGVLIALAGLRLLILFAAQFSPRSGEIHLDGVVLAVGVVTSIAAAIVLSYVPRIGSDRLLAASLAPASRRMTLGAGRRRVQRSLVAVQVAVCMVLLTGAGLLVRTLMNLQAVATGVRVDHVLTMSLPLGGDLIREMGDQPGNLARYTRMRDAVAALPGVSGAALGSGAPLRSSMMAFDINAENVAVRPDAPTPRAALTTVDPGYFEATGIPLVAGRDFASTDVRGSTRVVILSQSFARQLFGKENPIGRRIAPTGAVLKVTPFTGDWRTVVGVVGDTRNGGLDADVSPEMYEPFAQEVIIGASLVIRTASDPDQMKATVLRTLRAAFPDQLIEKVATVAEIRDESIATRRLNAMFIASFGGLALLIAMVGIAGVLAFSVRSRTSEIGIRMSLGADAGRVRRMVLSEGAGVLGIGLGAGAIGALFASRVLRGILFGVTPHDPITLGTVAALLGTIGVLACWLPAARAARVDPAVALRAE